VYRCKVDTNLFQIFGVLLEMLQCCRSRLSNTKNVTKLPPPPQQNQNTYRKSFRFQERVATTQQINVGGLDALSFCQQLLCGHCVHITPANTRGSRSRSASCSTDPGSKQLLTIGGRSLEQEFGTQSLDLCFVLISFLERAKETTRSEQTKNVMTTPVRINKPFRKAYERPYRLQRFPDDSSSAYHPVLSTSCRV
jgi:hypothetical protein